MTNKAASILLAFFMAAPLPGNAQHPVSYRLDQIPTFDEPNPETLGLAFAINDLGEVVGIAEDKNLIARGFLYQAGHLTEITGFNNRHTADVRAINQFAEVAGGAAMDVVFNGHPGTVTMPFSKTPGGPHRALVTGDEIARGVGGLAYGINDAGAVVFETTRSLISMPDGARIEWGFPERLLDLTLIGSINNRGQLVGAGYPVGAEGFQALLYDLAKRSAVNLHRPFIARSSLGADINNHGVVVGDWQLLENNRTVPVIWENERPRELPFVNAEPESERWIGRAVAINDLGDILGESSRDGERLDWLLFAGEAAPIPLLELIEESFFETFDDFLAFDLNNNRELAGAAISHDPGAPLGSTNKPAILRPTIARPVPRPAPGLWANTAAPGSGVEINRVGDRHYLIWYTYDRWGMPTWYFSDAIALVRDGWRANLFHFTRDNAGVVQREPAGRVVMSNLSESALMFSWRLPCSGGTVSFRYLPGNCSRGAGAATGTWYDPGDSGFGVSLQQTGGDAGGVFYFYDLDGQARWVYLDFPGGASSAEAWLYVGGACPGCAAATPTRSAVGTAEVALRAADIDLQVDLPGTLAPSALQWHSANRMVRLSSPAACGQ